MFGKNEDEIRDIARREARNEIDNQGICRSQIKETIAECITEMVYPAVIAESTRTSNLVKLLLEILSEATLDKKIEFNGQTTFTEEVFPERKTRPLTVRHVLEKVIDP